MFKTQDSPVGQAFAGCEVIEFRFVNKVVNSKMAKYRKDFTYSRTSMARNTFGTMKISSRQG